jgi:hypothetical protein
VAGLFVVVVTHFRQILQPCIKICSLSKGIAPCSRGGGRKRNELLAHSPPEQNFKSEISGFRGGEYEDDILLFLWSFCIK